MAFPRNGRPGWAPHLASLLVFLAVTCVWGATVAQARTGLGDPFFPEAGNPGYDVGHYGVKLAYSPSRGELRATATIDASALKRLPRFSLDLKGLGVTGVTVDRKPARFSSDTGKLTVFPAEAPAAGARFLTVVHYRGVPRKVIDPDGSAEGWIRTGDGALGLGEPVGTAAWMPCNDSPADKATFEFEITVPAPLKGVANGRLLRVRGEGGRKTFVWSEGQAMAPYLAVVDIGRGRLARSEIAGLPAWTLLDPKLARASRRVLAQLPRIVRFESRIFGPYPFDAVGSIVDPVPIEYALETQTRPIYAFVPDRATVVHETAHQWFGDSVGLTRWPEIWLNEGFATWTEWFYAERHGGPSARHTFNRFYRTPASTTEFWNPPSGHPGTAKHLFGPSVYLRGGLALEALRMKIGTEDLLAILRDWATAHRYGNAAIPQFIALAEEVSGRDLGPFFNAWLYTPGRPPGYAPRSVEGRGGPAGTSPLLFRRVLPGPPLPAKR